MITLHVLNDRLERIGVIEHFRNLSWNEDFQGAGSFTLIVNDTERYAALIRRGCYLYRTDRDTAMRIVRIERGGQNNTINAYGFSALNLLSFRVWKGEKTLSNVEADVLDMVSQTAQDLPLLVAQPRGFDDQQAEETVIEPKQLDAAVLQAIENTGIGVKMTLDYSEKRFVFQTYKGKDLAYKEGSGGYVFSSDRKNLESLTVTEDDDYYKNVAVIVCGTGETLRIFTYPENADELTGTARRELVVSGETQNDRTEDEWKTAMLRLGKNALAEHNDICNFTAVPKPGAFGVRYDLGDKVTCLETRYGVQFDAHITQYKHYVENGAEQVVLTLGRPSLSYIKGELIKNG